MATHMQWKMMVIFTRAPVFEDNTVDWDRSYELDPCDEDVEHVAHMCKLLQDMEALTIEHHNEVFVK